MPLLHGAHRRRLPMHAQFRRPFLHPVRQVLLTRQTAHRKGVARSMHDFNPAVRNGSNLSRHWLRGLIGAVRWLALLIPLTVEAPHLDAAPADGCPRTVYFSTGDNQDLLWVPLDSRASIDAAFTTLRDRYQ